MKLQVWCVKPEAWKGWSCSDPLSFSILNFSLCCSPKPQRPLQEQQQNSEKQQQQKNIYAFASSSL